MEDGRKASFMKNQENPLEADVIIIDEMSMVDIHLFQALLQAIPIGTRLILVGDVDQLPSVGPGQVLRDLMKSECFSMVVLEHIFRQAKESDIIVNAHRINKGEEIGNRFGRLFGVQLGGHLAKITNTNNNFWIVHACFFLFIVNRFCSLGWGFSG